MKMIHLSDLHLGKRLNGYSLIEDQQDILKKILEIIQEEKPDAVLIAGDIYDKSVPPAEAVTLFDAFLCSLSELDTEVFAISGNHDSAERISFGSRIMNRQGIHMTGVYDGTVQKTVMEDEYGKVNIFSLPFLKTASVRKYHEYIENVNDMMKALVCDMEIDPSERNVLVTHQFVTGAARSESEEIAGGAESVDGKVVESFDYVALGHLHRPQGAVKEHIRYCGTPLKYSFSEASHEKSVTVVELKEKGSLSIREVPLVPLHDMRIISGTYDELVSKKYYTSFAADDYLQIILKDEDEVFGAFDRLSGIYPRIMKLEYENSRSRLSGSVENVEMEQAPSAEEMFSRLYYIQNGREMSPEEKEYISRTAKSMTED